MGLYPLKLEGTPREIGFKRGLFLKDLINSIFNDYLHKIKNNEYLINVKNHIEKVLLREFPEFIEELEGIAEGSKVLYDDLLLFLAWWSHPITCSNVALTKTSQGPILGSTLDVGIAPYRVMLLYLSLIHI